MAIATIDDLKAEAFEDEGFILITIKLINSNSTSESEDLVLTRTNLFDNTTQEIYRKTIKFNSLNAEAIFKLRDCFAETGIPYRYELSLGSTKETVNAPILVLNGAFLSNPALQMRVLYDCDISNFKFNTKDTVTPTLGRQYPFITRQGVQKYRSFNIKGTLSYHAENYGLDRLDQTITDSYRTVDIETEPFVKSLFLFNSNTDLSCYDNLSIRDKEICYEKFFRDKAMSFLTDANIKLFRSATEGNIYVRLTNTSFTPRKQLNGLVYDFTAEAIECMNQASGETYFYSNSDLVNWGVQIDSYSLDAAAIISESIIGIRAAIIDANGTVNIAPAIIIS